VSRRLGAGTALAISAVGAVAAGFAHACSVAAPWNGQPLWWLQIIALACLVALVQRAPSVKNAALMGWLFATAWIAGSTWWLFISMHTFGGLAAPLAALAILALSGFLALYYAAACAFYKRFGALTQVNPAQAAIIFAAAWLLAELARDTWFTGFPWAAGGYAQVDGPIAASASVWGVYGVGFVASVVATCLARVLGSRRRGRSWPSMVSLGVLACVVAAATLLGTVDAGSIWGIFTRSHLVNIPSNAKMPRAQDVQRTSVALLQGNIPQGEKFDSSKGVPIALEWYAQQLAASTATMVVAPETAIPLLPQQLPPEYWAALQTRFKTGNQAALIGVPLGDYETGYANSVMGFMPLLPDAKNVMQPQPYRYDKHHLVPFGEFTPALFKWFTRMMNIPLGDFNRGAVGQASLEWAGQRWAPNICYEDLFGDELAARFKDESTAPTVLVNMSNIGWFGDSIAIDQHLHISRMRAIELGRPMLRATNTGPTVIIDHRGQVTHSLPRHTRGVLMGEVEGRSGITPYAWWAARFGLWPLWLLGLFVVGAAWLMARRHSARAEKVAAKAAAR
jgi:apolipoprotein N-acyltransferase